MPRAEFIDDQGQRHAVDARSGTSLMRAAIDAGLQGIAADCGGVLSCATCHVYVDEPWRSRLDPPADDELAMLEMTAADRTEASRLSCQIVLSDTIDGLVVRLPATQY